MSDVTVVLERITCRNTTEAGHDEVYYLSPTITRINGDNTSTDPPLASGPTLAQGANAGGPRGANTAWDCNDSGALSDQLLDADLFPVRVDPGDHVFVTINFMESDGDDAADIEAKYAAATAAVVSTIASLLGAAAVLVPVNLAISAVTDVFQALKALSVTGNDDDPLGSVALELKADGPNVWFSQVGVGAGSLVETPVDGTPARVSARLQGSGADYSVTIRLDGAVTQKSSAALTMEPPLTQDLTPADFVSWGSAGPNGATGTLHGDTVTMVGPMGTAFFLHDDYPNFNRPTFTPQLPATGMVEIQGAPAHTFTLTFQTPVQDPVLLLGSLGSVMTLPPGTGVSKISGDAGLRIADHTVTGEPEDAVVAGGPNDSNGTVRLNGVFSEITFALVFGDGSVPDGVFFQIGGTRPI
jgi:hypothetical protein